MQNEMDDYLTMIKGSAMLMLNLHYPMSWGCWVVTMLHSWIVFCREFTLQESHLQQFFNNPIAQEHSKKTAEKTTCCIKQSDESIVCTQQSEILVAECGEGSETATHARGEQECYGRVAKMTTRCKCIEHTDEQAANNVHYKGVIREYAYRIILHKLWNEEA